MKSFNISFRGKKDVDNIVAEKYERRDDWFVFLSEKGEVMGEYFVGSVEYIKLVA